MGKQKICIVLGLFGILTLSGCEPERQALSNGTAMGMPVFTQTVPKVADATIWEAERLYVELSEPEISEITISLAGDCSLGKLSIHGYSGTFYQEYDRNGAAYFFQNVKEIFEKDDMTLVNFEGVLTDSTDIQEKQFNIKGEEEYNQILTEGDIEAVSFGNNHRIDYGEEGISDTIAAFEEVGVVYAYDDILGIYETEEGIRIGYVSVNEVYDGETVEEFLENGIGLLRREGANIILACCHWGIEREYYPNAYQKELGRKCIDWGADLVVGCHPHVLQGIEYYNGKYIIYSLGNFCFGGNKNPAEKNTMIVQADFTLEDGVIAGEADLKVIPCRISSVSNRNDYCPTPAEGKRYHKIIDLLNRYSTDMGITIDENGVVMPVVAENSNVPQ